MKFNKEQYEKLEATTPSAEDVKERTREYLAVSQITPALMATRINYGASSLRHFLKGTYIEHGLATTDVRIRRALVDFMDAHPIEISTETQGRLHETSNVVIMRQWFERTLAGREMAFVYGPPGAQKTFVLQHLVAAHNKRELPKNGHGTRAYYVYCSEQMKPRELLRKMCFAAAVPGSTHILTMLRNLAYSLSSRRTMFCLDEAQHLSIGCLEIVRELNDCDPRAAVLLSGSHKLLQIFQTRAAELEQWNSRISKGIELPGITTPEAHAIIEAELGTLPTKQLQALLDHSQVVDGYSKRKNATYLSARRLFRQVEQIKSDPRFQQVDAAQHQLQGAA